LQYFGGKQRIAKELAAFLLPFQETHKYFYEPFVGGCNIIPLMKGERFASDKNEYLIDMYIALQQNWNPPQNITKEEYEYIKNNKNENKALTGFVGIGCSYSGKWFGGLAKNNTPRNYCLNAYNSLMRLKPLIADIKFKYLDYKDAHPKRNLIYCDPPYAGTTKYGAIGDFNSDEFWNVMRLWSKNNTVFISEYNAPEDFKCVWKKETKLDIKNKDGEKELRIEKLFQLT
jgi:DNA adenine methylase